MCVCSKCYSYPCAIVNNKEQQVSLNCLKLKCTHRRATAHTHTRTQALALLGTFKHNGGAMQHCHKTFSVFLCCASCIFILGISKNNFHLKINQTISLICCWLAFFFVGKNLELKINATKKKRDQKKRSPLTQHHNRDLLKFKKKLKEADNY